MERILRASDTAYTVPRSLPPVCSGLLPVGTLFVEEVLTPATGQLLILRVGSSGIKWRLAGTTMKYI